MRLRAQLVALWRGDIPLGQAFDDGIYTERSPDTGGSGLLRPPVPQGALWAMGIAHEAKPNFQFR
jgi:hypothetical protein